MLEHSTDTGEFLRRSLKVGQLMVGRYMLPVWNLGEFSAILIHRSTAHTA